MRNGTQKIEMKTYADLLDFSTIFYELNIVNRRMMLEYAEYMMCNKLKAQLVLIPELPFFKNHGDLFVEVLDFIKNKEEDEQAYELFDSFRNYLYLDKWPVKTLVTSIDLPDCEILCKLIEISNSIKSKTIIVMLPVSSEEEAYIIGQRWQDLYDCYYYDFNKSSLLSYLKDNKCSQLIIDFVESLEDSPEDIRWNPAIFQQLENIIQNMASGEELKEYCKSIIDGRTEHIEDSTLLLMDELAKYWKSHKLDDEDDHYITGRVLINKYTEELPSGIKLYVYKERRNFEPHFHLFNQDKSIDIELSIKGIESLEILKSHSTDFCWDNHKNLKEDLITWLFDKDLKTKLTNADKIIEAWNKCNPEHLIESAKHKEDTMDTETLEILSQNT